MNTVTAVCVRTAATNQSAFVFNQQPVRVFLIDGNPWFAAVDICEILGIVNARDAIQKLDEDERMQVIDSTTVGLTDGTQINNLLNVVSESGMNALVLRCRDAMTQGTPAHRFRKWVTSEVLPSIRKTGSYPSPRPIAPTISTKQYQELERIVDILADALNAIPQAKLIIWNAVRFATNTENVNKLTLDQFQRAKALLVQMHENTYGDFLPWLRTIEREYITNCLCQGVPSTGEMKKQWQKQYQTGLPQPINWRNIALTLENKPN